jgi:nicotinamidase-related amidase
MLFRQSGYDFDRAITGPTDEEIKRILKEKTAPVFTVEKTTRSVFKSGNAYLYKDLRKRGIEEIHFLGYDINDCVMASLLDANDEGFFTYILEDLCHHNKALPDLKEAALHLMRRHKLTDKSRI